jgi:hypothetical protein
MTAASTPVALSSITRQRQVPVGHDEVECIGKAYKPSIARFPGSLRRSLPKLPKLDALIFLR